VIFDTSNETLKKFRIIVIKLHKLDILLDKHGHQIIKPAFNKILKISASVHIYPNNSLAPIKYRGCDFPLFMEFAFLKKGRI
jgi:hypothetical protein